MLDVFQYACAFLQITKSDLETDFDDRPPSQFLNCGLPFRTSQIPCKSLFVDLQGICSLVKSPVNRQIMICGGSLCLLDEIVS